MNEKTQTISVGFDVKDYGFYRRGGAQYITSKEFTGKVVITKADTATGVVSGTFEFVAGNSQGNKINITNGRFDVNVRTQ